MGGGATRSKAGPDGQRWKKIANRAAIVLLVVGLLADLLFSLGVTGAPDAFLGVFASAVLFSCASLAVGGLLGFLFGVPRTPSSENEPTPERGRVRFRANTNLEQVSDWLTKVLIGATLVQLGSVPASAADLFSSMAPSLGGHPHSAAFAGAIVIYFSILGFLGGWLVTRLYLANAMRDADAEEVGKLVVEAEVAEKEGDSVRAKKLRDAAQRRAVASSDWWDTPSADWGSSSSGWGESETPEVAETPEVDPNKGGSS